jgi:two-component system phosphate regulon response regulator PhoB
VAATVLVVEDERKLRELVRSYLERAGFTVLSTESGAEALTLAASAAPDLVVLDLGLPDVPGETIARELRAAGSTPIVMLTARSAEEDRIRGLELGADDYVTKPFSPRELVLRVKRLLRSTAAEHEKADHFLWKELEIDIPRHEVKVKGRALDLTSTEFKLLSTLALRRGRVQSREALLRDVWEYDSLIDTRTVDTHMRRLREKLGPAAKYLGTVRGVGYRFADE